MQISIELSETSKVSASQPGYVFQSDDLGQVPLAKPIRWKSVDDELAIQYLKWKVQNAIGFLFPENIETPELLPC